MRIILEIGLNHMGNPKLAHKILKKCLSLPIYGITMQILPSKYYDNSKKFRRQLKIGDYKKFALLTKNKGKKFGLALMDEFTFEKFKILKPNFYKVLSLGFGNNALLKKIYKTKSELFVSTGFENMHNIKKICKKYPKINIIHTSLSDKAKDANLLAISKMKNETSNKVSFGLHSTDHEIILTAAGYLPDTLFFYVKPDKKDKYPDDNHAIKLNTLPGLLKMITNAIISRGSGNKIKQKVPKWVYE